MPGLGRPSEALDNLPLCPSQMERNRFRQRGNMEKDLGQFQVMLELQRCREVETMFLSLPRNIRYTPIIWRVPEKTTM